MHGDGTGEISQLDKTEGRDRGVVLNFRTFQGTGAGRNAL